MILLTRSEEIVLLAVYKLGENAYGVTIRDQIHGDVGRYWAFGAIYKTLKKMLVKDFVRKVPGDPLSERGGRTRYYYRITRKGFEALEEISKVHDSLWGSVSRLRYEE